MSVIVERACIADLFGTFIERGHVLIEGDRIEEVGEGAAEGAGADRVDAEGRLLTPGLVNAHAHLYSTLARGMPLPGFAPTDFRSILEGLWWRLDRALDLEAVYFSALVGALWHLRAGVTALFDHHASPNAIEGSLSQIRQAAVEEVGLRADLCYEVTDRGGKAQRDAGIEENTRFALEAGGGRCAAHMGLHASFTLSDDTLVRAAQAAEPLGLPFHIHLAEGKEDPVHALRQYGMRTAERLDHFGILTERSLLAHGVHLSRGELDLLADRPASVIHNPRSNMNNAVGTARVSDYLARGIRMGIGTDGFGCDILGELLSAQLLARHLRGDPTALGDGALVSLLAHNYVLAQGAFGAPMGKVAPGYAADLVLWDYDPPTPLTGENLLAHLLFGVISEGVRPHTLWVAGEMRLAAGRPVDLDEEGTLARSREVAKRLWARIR